MVTSKIQNKCLCQAQTLRDFLSIQNKTAQSASPSSASPEALILNTNKQTQLFPNIRYYPALYVADADNCQLTSKVSLFQRGLLCPIHLNYVCLLLFSFMSQHPVFFYKVFIIFEVTSLFLTVFNQYLTPSVICKFHNASTRAFLFTQSAGNILSTQIFME